MRFTDKVKKYWWVFAGLLLLTFIVIFFTSCGDGGGNGLPDDDEIYRGRLYEQNKLTTPKGAIIAAKFRIDPSFGALVDAGLDDVYRIASAPPNNYDVSDMGHRTYKVWLYPRSSRCENPGFLVDATGSPYEGSEWDKDPSPTRCLLCAAGMTLMQGFPTIWGSGMLITDDAGIMRTIVRYEAEHSILFFKDPPRYNATMYHAQGQGHPILGEGPAEMKFKPATLVLSDGFAGSGSACVLLTK